MKDLSLLVWLSQLGLSVVVPPAVFILIAVWLRKSYQWGTWVIWVAVILGVYCAITGLVQTVRALDKLSAKKDERTQSVSFNDHD